MVTLASRVASDPTRSGALAARPAYDAVDAKAAETLEALKSAIGLRVKQGYDEANDVAIGRVADTTTLTHEAATQTEAAAIELSQLSNSLRMVSDRFRH